MPTCRANAPPAPKCARMAFIRLDLFTGEMNVQNFNACVGCRICAEFCPANAIRINPAEPEYITRYPWTFSTVEEIHYKAQTGEYLLRGFGTHGQTPNFDMITVVPSQIASAAPLDKYREECDMQVVIGEDTCENPVVLKAPFVWPAMSFGALEQRGQDGPGHRRSHDRHRHQYRRGRAGARRGLAARVAMPIKERTHKKWEPGRLPDHPVVYRALGRIGRLPEQRRCGRG